MSKISNNNSHETDNSDLNTSIQTKRPISKAKITLVVCGIFLILGGLALILASLLFTPQGLSTINAWKIGGLTGSVLLIGGGIVCILGGTLKSLCGKARESIDVKARDSIDVKARDSTDDYEFAFLKEIADKIITCPYDRSLVDREIYKIKYENIGYGDTVYPSTEVEIKDYESKVPAIVRCVRDRVQEKLKIAVPISQLSETLSTHHQTLFDYRF